MELQKNKTNYGTSEMTGDKIGSWKVVDYKFTNQNNCTMM